jgi:hypothetical protein
LKVFYLPPLAEGDSNVVTIQVEVNEAHVILSTPIIRKTRTYTYYVLTAPHFASSGVLGQLKTNPHPILIPYSTISYIKLPNYRVVGDTTIPVDDAVAVLLSRRVICTMPKGASHQVLNGEIVFILIDQVAAMALRKDEILTILVNPLEVNAY